jgi:hypothetical protein
MGGHPEVDAHAKQISRLIARGRAWKNLQPVLQQSSQGPGSEQLDRQLVQGWNASLFDGWKVAEPERSRLQDAQRRLQAVTEQQRSVTPARGPDTPQSAAELPPEYEYKERDGVPTAQRSLAALGALTESIRQGTSEKAIVEAADEMVRIEAQSLIDAAAQCRVVLARQRLPVLQTLEKIPKSFPQDRYDEEILRAWRDDLLRDCPQALEWIPVYQAAVNRKKRNGGQDSSPR